MMYNDDKRMAMVRKELIPLQKEEYKSLILICRELNLPEDILELPKKKLYKSSMRIQFIFFLYKYLLEHLSKRTSMINNNLNDYSAFQISVLAELVIDAQYYDNYVYDKKSGAVADRKKKDYTNKATKLRLVIKKYASTIFAENHILACYLIKKIELIDNLVEYGQKAEQLFNHFHTFKKCLNLVKFDKDVECYINQNILNDVVGFINMTLPGLKEAEKQFLNLYVKRIYLTSAILFQEFAKILFKTMDIKDYTLESNTIDFSTQFGLMIQIVNDNIDFIPMGTSSKPAMDACSDLYNNNITLPIFCHLVTQKTPSIINEILTTDNKELYFFFEKDCNSDKCYKIIHDRYLVLILNAIRADILYKSMQIGRNIINVNLLAADCLFSNLLFDMIKISDSNQFYTYLINQSFFESSDNYSAFGRATKYTKNYNEPCGHKTDFVKIIPTESRLIITIKPSDNNQFTNHQMQN